MVAMIITRRMRTALSALVGGFVLMGAHPAMAETVQSKNQPQDVVQSPLGEGDAEFRKLFSGWGAQDSNIVKPAVLKVAIPSRMPVEGVKMTSDYGMRVHPVLGGRRAHKGVDLAAPSGTPVFATADGTVGMAQWYSSYGKYISIDHGADLETRYAHLSDYIVAPGQSVKKGQLIGYIGSTGRSTGPHLHYEVRVAGEAVNPVPYMVDTEARQAIVLARGKGGVGGPE